MLKLIVGFITIIAEVLPFFNYNIGLNTQPLKKPSSDIYRIT